MKDDIKYFEKKVERLIIAGLSPMQAYWSIEMKHKRKHGCRMYYSYAHFVRATKIIINTTLKIVKS